MKPEEIDVAVETSLGFLVELSALQSGLDVIGDGKYRRPARNYHDSLDACAEFERCNQNTYKDLEAYENILWRICRDQNIGKDNPLPPAIAHVIATAPQRCEAYLRMKGLWHE